MSARHRCCRLFRCSERGVLVNGRLSTECLLNQAIGEAGHRDAFRLCAEVQSGHEITPELRRIPFRAVHDVRGVLCAWQSYDSLLKSI